MKIYNADGYYAILEQQMKDTGVEEIIENNFISCSIIIVVK